MIVPILKLIGGLALFLYGLDLAGEGLQKFSVQKMRVLLHWLIRNRLSAFILGGLATLAFQSSGAVSVMLTSFVNSSLVRLDQAFAILLGSNVGTTFTVQILAFDLSGVALLAVGAGYLILKGMRSERMKYVGRALMGFGLLFYGMGLLSGAMAPLKDMAFVREGLELVKDSFGIGFLAATLLTAILHNSAAVVVLAMTLAHQGVFNFQETLPLVFGANVGTCATALLASWGRGPNAWRLSLGHLSMKLAGVAIFCPWLSGFAGMVEGVTSVLSLGPASPERLVANAHTLLNVLVSLLLLPATRAAAQGLRRIIPGPRHPEGLNLSEGGMEAIHQGLSQMGSRVRAMILHALTAFRDNDERALRKITDADEEVDLLNSQFKYALTRRTAKTSEHEMKILYGVDQLEHLGDLLSKDLAVLAQKKIERDLEFSMEGERDLEEFHAMVYNLFDQAFAAFSHQDKVLTQAVIEGCETAKKFKRISHQAHLERLRKGITESMNTSSIYLDLIADLERMCDHILNLAKEA